MINTMYLKFQAEALRYGENVEEEEYEDERQSYIDQRRMSIEELEYARSENGHQDNLLSQVLFFS